MKVIGVWFMSMSVKAAWLETIFFDMVIGATIDPVTAT